MPDIEMDEECKKEWDVPSRVWTLEETSELMRSGKYDERFIAEYLQTKIRYEKLRRFIAKLHAFDIRPYARFRKNEDLSLTTNNCSCPLEVLEQQANAMDSYLKILELRAAIENIPLPPYRLDPAIPIDPDNLKA